MNNIKLPSVSIIIVIALLFIPSVALAKYISSTASVRVVNSAPTLNISTTIKKESISLNSVLTGEMIELNQVSLLNNEPNSLVYVSVDADYDGLNFFINESTKSTNFKLGKSGNGEFSVSVQWDKHSEKLPVYAQLHYVLNFDF